MDAPPLPYFIPHILGFHSKALTSRIGRDPNHSWILHRGFVRFLERFVNAHTEGVPVLSLSNIGTKIDIVFLAQFES